jgi:hypothetical protein
MRGSRRKLLLYGKVVPGKPGSSLVKFAFGEKLPEPGQVGDELDAAVQLSHLPQSLETLRGKAGLAKCILATVTTLLFWAIMPRNRVGL